MGRVLLVIGTWQRQTESALDAERAMLIDFAVQHPRSIAGLAPAVVQVVRAHALHKTDLSDVFAQRHFGSMREHFFTTIAELVARDLVVTTGQDKADLFLLPTQLGHDATEKFSSPLAIGLRSLCSVLADEWRRKNVRDLSDAIRKVLPDESRIAASLLEPFAFWMSESE